MTSNGWLVGAQAGVALQVVQQAQDEAFGRPKKSIERKNCCTGAWGWAGREGRLSQDVDKVAAMPCSMRRGTGSLERKKDSCCYLERERSRRVSKTAERNCYLVWEYSTPSSSAMALGVYCVIMSTEQWERWFDETGCEQECIRLLQRNLAINRREAQERSTSTNITTVGSA